MFEDEFITEEQLTEAFLDGLEMEFENG